MSNLKSTVLRDCSYLILVPEDRDRLLGILNVAIQNLKLLLRSPEVQNSHTGKKPLIRTDVSLIFLLMSK